MAGVSAIVIKESLDELGERLRQVEQPITKSGCKCYAGSNKHKHRVSARLRWQLANI